ncbi:MAG: macrocin O-methyltransferase [Rhodospirillaceae bacterium]|nr:macrocin O-methyltransferase [Rhodospirillaceae bacterium]
MSGNSFKKIRRELSKAWRKLLPGVAGATPWPEDFTDDMIALCRKVGPYTMTSPERIATLSRAVEYVVSNDIAGDMVECGVAAGGSSMTIAFTLLAHGHGDRKIWLYDTYEGMPEPGPHDLGRFGTPAIHAYRKRQVDGTSTWINVPLATVQHNMALTGYPDAQIKYVAGKVETTLHETVPDAVSLIRCDTDWYESTKAELEILWPRLSVGGVILFDDYYRWQGSRKAADEYFRDHNVRIFLSRIDAHAAIGVKQAP